MIHFEPISCLNDWTLGVFLRSKLCVIFGGRSNAVKAQCHNRSNSWAKFLKYETNYIVCILSNFRVSVTFTLTL